MIGCMNRQVVQISDWSSLAIYKKVEKLRDFGYDVYTYAFTSGTGVVTESVAKQCIKDLHQMGSKPICLLMYAERIDKCTDDTQYIVSNLVVLYPDTYKVDKLLHQSFTVHYGKVVSQGSITRNKENCEKYFVCRI